MKLPEPKTKSQVSLEEALKKRRSVRQFTRQSLTWEQISQLLWAAQGITDKQERLRAAPSAGATYPLEVYLVMKEGIYRYKPDSHEVERTIERDVRHELCQAAFDQRQIEEAPVNIVIAATYRRTESRYGERAIRYVHMEVGHAAQNIHLQAAALGLGSVPVGAFSDDQVQMILSLPKNQQPLYIIPVGYPAE